MNRSMQKFIYHSIKVLFISMIIFRLNAQETSIKIIKSRVYQSIIENHLNGYSNSTMVNFDENINQISSDFDGEKWPFIK